MVLAQSLFKILKLQHPDCIIDVAAPAWTLPLIARMPEVNHGIALPFKHGQFALFERIKFGKSLRLKAYTQAIILTNSFKSAILPYAANIPQRTSFLGEMRYGLLNDIRSLDKTMLPRTVDRFVTLGLPAGANIPQHLPNPTLITNKENAAEALKVLGLEVPRNKVLGLCPGAEYGPSKRWPTEHFAVLAQNLITQNSNNQIILLGSKSDHALAQEITSRAKPADKIHNWCGDTSLDEAIALIGMSKAVVSNDSGLMHVAAALQIPQVAIFGSSDPAHTPPLSDRAKIIWLNMTCSPCHKRVCPLGHLRCLKDILPEQVLATLNTLK